MWERSREEAVLVEASINMLPGTVFRIWFYIKNLKYIVFTKMQEFDILKISSCAIFEVQH